LSRGVLSDLSAAYSDGVDTCELCGDPIERDQAWMIDERGATAHSGCVYRADEADRDRWMPPE